jgi:hypothetical protein
MHVRIDHDQIRHSSCQHLPAMHKSEHRGGIAPTARRFQPLRVAAAVDDDEYGEVGRNGLAVGAGASCRSWKDWYQMQLQPVVMVNRKQM